MFNSMAHPIQLISTLIVILAIGCADESKPVSNSGAAPKSGDTPDGSDTPESSGDDTQQDVNEGAESADEAQEPTSDAAPRQSCDGLAPIWRRTSSISSNLALSGDGRTALVGVQTKALVWDLVGGKLAATLDRHTGTIHAVALNNDGTVGLTTGSTDNTAIVWALPSGRRRRMLTAADDSFSIEYCALNPDGNRVATAWHGVVGVGGGAVWRVESGEALRTFVSTATGGEPPDTVWSSANVVAFGPGLRRALLGHSDESVSLWDLASGRKLRVLRGHQHEITAVAFSADGKTAITGSQDKTAIVWSMDTGAKLQILTGHKGEVHSVAISGDGEHVVTGSDDDTAVLWNAVSGEKLSTFAGNQPGDAHTRVDSVVMSSDGRRVVTWTGGNLRIWDCKSGKELARLYVDFGGENWIVVTPEGEYDGTDEAVDQLVLQSESTPYKSARDCPDKQRTGLLGRVWGH